ncbi:ABC-type transport auxiliary lipoprotein family protein [Sphingomonas cavernae]|uniref:ABC transporter n=1 Tax=Sphingomonas cavernae TaxID=2320861 RepID=A0A418WRY3_9SPHN|nr:ABC-type transport auxiliary lipoprotein family protein [Sphingomonas cavernae]RJF94023.1 ABC transporter [Sphingomonas cavernae]
MKTRTLSALVAAFVLAGCISFGAEPPPSLLSLTPEATTAAGTSRTIAPGEAITVLPPRVPAALATNRVPVQADATNIAYVKDAQWVDNPNRLFRALLSETIAAKTGRVVMDFRQFSFDPGVRIGGELRNFGVDAQAMEAVVTYDATRTLPGSDRIEERRFEARVPVTEVRAGPVGVALNSAANKVAADVAAWIGG